MLIANLNGLPQTPHDINSPLSRCSTAMGSSTAFSRVSPKKLEARECFLFAEGSLVLKIKDTWLITDLALCISSSGQASHREETTRHRT